MSTAQKSKLRSLLDRLKPSSSSEPEPEPKPKPASQTVKQPSGPVIEQAAVEPDEEFAPPAPESVTHRLARVDWDRSGAVEPPPTPWAEEAEGVDEDAGRAGFEIATVQQRFGAVNWTRDPNHQPEGAAPPAAEDESAKQSVDAFFADVQW